MNEMTEAEKRRLTAAVIVFYFNLSPQQQTDLCEALKNGDDSFKVELLLHEHTFNYKEIIQNKAPDQQGDDFNQQIAQIKQIFIETGICDAADAADAAAADAAADADARYRNTENPGNPEKKRKNSTKRKKSTKGKKSNGSTRSNGSTGSNETYESTEPKKST